MAEHKKWEYKVLDWDSLYKNGFLDGMGRDGWELVSVLRDENNLTYYFKREVAMNKEEMMAKYYLPSLEENYQEAKERIKEAMLNGAKYVYLPGKNGSPDEFEWMAAPETIERLRDDGFDIDQAWDPWEYWSIEWA